MASAAYEQDIELQATPQPRRPRGEARTLKCSGGKSITTYTKLEPWEMVCESDSQIWQKVVDAYYQHHGKWRKWLPFYGITEVFEVLFQFAGVVEEDGKYPIRIEPLLIENVKADCHRIRKQCPFDSPFFFDNVCLWPYHTDECRNMMEFQPCIREAAEDADWRLTRLSFREDLLKCALRPEAANGLRSLDRGYVQDGCIYDVRGTTQFNVPQRNEPFCHGKPLRGLQLTSGWQKERMVVELPFKAACTWLGIATVWLCVLLIREERGDWDLALALAQVVAASVAILITLLRG
ncbi:hypothetical protein JX265_006786 [Neoarthrinium moseri]|uniref:Uncharacterized protein n=1 Tax=Neoarthrinium moseri TaxID=1658444 RepID=A0A9Q0AQB5_9PEZI|nr:hypothetical protein JX266_006893 [Neoarthrinium moseri]KAI1868807.1 hypothetical protein JX265_006786 [Neoarthrinium moseri]